MNVNVSVNNSCPSCNKPEPPAPPKKPLAGYDDASTEFVVARPDMGIVLRTENKALKVHCGDLIKDLTYADKNLKLQTVTGVLSNVLCRVEMRPTGVQPPFDAPNIIRSTKAMDNCCCPPHHPMGGRIIPAVIVLDLSSQYGSSVINVPIEAIRDFTADEIDPDDIRVWDFDFMTDTQVVFYSKFKPKMVLWNGKEVDVVKARGNVEGAQRYGIDVDTIYDENSIVVIGGGSVIVSTTVRGYAPTTATITPDDLKEAISTVETALKNATYDGTVGMIKLLENCYGLDEVQIALGEDATPVAMDKVSIKPNPINDEGEVVVPIVSIDGQHNLYVNPVVFQYLVYMNASIGVKFVINGFNIEFPTLYDADNEPLKLTNFMLVYETSENDSACPCKDGEIHLTRYDRTCGLSYLIVDDKSEKVPAGSTNIIGVRNDTQFERRDENAQTLDCLVLTRVVNDPMKSGEIVDNYSTDPVVTENTSSRMIDVVIPGKGSTSIKFVTHTKKE